MWVHYALLPIGLFPFEREKNIPFLHHSLLSVQTFLYVWAWAYYKIILKPFFKKRRPYRLNILISMHGTIFYGHSLHRFAFRNLNYIIILFLYDICVFMATSLHSFGSNRFSLCMSHSPFIKMCSGGLRSFFFSSSYYSLKLFISRSPRCNRFIWCSVRC